MMGSGRLNLAQRIVLVAGCGAALAFLGSYLTNLGTFRGWVAYAPLTSGVTGPPPNGLHAWARLLIWLGMVLLWTLVSLALLRAPRHRDVAEQVPGPSRGRFGVLANLATHRTPRQNDDGRHDGSSAERHLRVRPATRITTSEARSRSVTARAGASAT